MTSEHLNAMLGKLGFRGESNIDVDTPTKPGTAIAWRNTVPICEVHNIVTNRLQVALLDRVAIINIYAPSGSDKKRERDSFFSRDIFDIFNIFPGYSYILAGDFNCVISPMDVENGTGYN